MERRNGQHSNVDCYLTSTVSNDDFTGDVIASSTSLVYEEPVVTEESPDASVVNTVTHSELVFEQWIDELAMEPRDEHDTNVHVKLTSSDGNDDFMRCNQVVVVGGVVGVAVDYVVEFGL